MANTVCRTKANEFSTRFPQGGEARGSMTADTAEEGRSGGVSRLRAKHTGRRGRRTGSFAGQDGGGAPTGARRGKRRRRRPRLCGAGVIEAAKFGLGIGTAGEERRAQDLGHVGDTLDEALTTKNEGEDRTAARGDGTSTRRRRF